MPPSATSASRKRTTREIYGGEGKEEKPSVRIREVHEGEEEKPSVRLKTKNAISALAFPSIDCFICKLPPGVPKDAIGNVRTIRDRDCYDFRSDNSYNLFTHRYQDVEDYIRDVDFIRRSIEAKEIRRKTQAAISGEPVTGGREDQGEFIIHDEGKQVYIDSPPIEVKGEPIVEYVEIPFRLSEWGLEKSCKDLGDALTGTPLTDDNSIAVRVNRNPKLPQWEKYCYNVINLEKRIVEEKKLNDPIITSYIYTPEQIAAIQNRATRARLMARAREEETKGILISLQDRISGISSEVTRAIDSRTLSEMTRKRITSELDEIENIIKRSNLVGAAIESLYRNINGIRARVAGLSGPVVTVGRREVIR